jgi:hypothetical protein
MACTNRPRLVKDDVWVRQKQIPDQFNTTPKIEKQALHPFPPGGDNCRNCEVFGLAVGDQEKMRNDMS